MRITSLVENTTKSELKTKHGLSLYIETKSHKILFDLGSDSTLFENATCHCTGEKAYHYLSQQMDNMNYMSCGDVIEI